MAKIIYGVAGEGFGHSSRSHLIGRHLLTLCALEHPPEERFARLNAQMATRCHGAGAAAYLILNFFRVSTDLTRLCRSATASSRGHPRNSSSWIWQAAEAL